MKSNAEIRFRDNVNLNLLGIEGKQTMISWDVDYCSDPDDVIQYVEEEIYNKYGFAFHYNIDFDIENFSEICEELEDRTAKSDIEQF